MRKRKNKIRYGLVAAFVFFLIGCAQETLYNNLNQEDANKVMVLLQQNGINAVLVQEIKQNEVFWSIKVSKEDLPKARELVVTSQVISPKSPGLQEVYQAKGAGGWIKTPAEERARYLLALKGEIVNSLKKITNVVDADVVLNVPEGDELGLKEKKHPTASVVIKAKTPEEGETPLNEIQVQQFVANTVDGMSARDVSVLIHFMAPLGTKLRPGQTILLPKTAAEAEALRQAGVPSNVRLMGLKLDADSKDRLKIYLIVFFLVLVILSLALIVAIVQTGRTRKELKQLQGRASGPALQGRVMGEESSPKIEAPDREEDEV